MIVRDPKPLPQAPGQRLIKPALAASPSLGWAEACHGEPWLAGMANPGNVCQAGQPGAVMADITAQAMECQR